MECFELWSVSLHIICHTSHKMNHSCSTTLFSRDAECSANSQSRHTGENRSGITLATNLSPPSLILLSWSLALFHLCLYLALSVAQTLPLPLSLSLSLSLSICPSPPLAFSLFLTQYTVTHSLDPTHLWWPWRSQARLRWPRARLCLPWRPRTRP